MNHSLILTQPFFLLRRIRLKFLVKCFWFLCIFSLVSLLVLYIFQLHASTKNLSMIHQYEKELNDINSENGGLEINYSALNYLENIENQIINNLAFEEVKEVKYLRVLDGQMAQIDFEFSSQ